MSARRRFDEAFETMRASMSEWNKAAREILRYGDAHDRAELEDALEFARDMALHYQQALDGDRRREQTHQKIDVGEPPSRRI